MADQPTSPFGDISMIRDILMGQQMSEYESRFQEISNLLQQMSEKFEQQLATLKEEHAAQMQQMQEANQQRFEKLEKVSKDDKHNLGQMLARISTQLMKEND